MRIVHQYSSYSLTTKTKIKNKNAVTITHMTININIWQRHIVYCVDVIYLSYNFPHTIGSYIAKFFIKKI